MSTRRRRQYGSPKRRQYSQHLYGVITQKQIHNNNDEENTVAGLNLKYCVYILIEKLFPVRVDFHIFDTTEQRVTK
jgi:hypothetical protein